MGADCNTGCDHDLRFDVVRRVKTLPFATGAAPHCRGPRKGYRSADCRHPSIPIASAPAGRQPCRTLFLDRSTDRRMEPQGATAVLSAHSRSRRSFALPRWPGRASIRWCMLVKPSRVAVLGSTARRQKRRALASIVGRNRRINKVASKCAQPCQGAVLVRSSQPTEPDNISRQIARRPAMPHMGQASAS
jgi:hypothetical protein